MATHSGVHVADETAVSPVTVGLLRIAPDTDVRFLLLKAQIFQHVHVLILRLPALDRGVEQIGVGVEKQGKNRTVMVKRLFRRTHVDVAFAGVRRRFHLVQEPVVVGVIVPRELTVAVERSTSRKVMGSAKSAHQAARPI